ncbi:MAG TPA: DeoR/GlpR family DNA-binding transcription regulator [bacterium]|nr:DeoR/GlpR family DNA-binding transcription regulator [bacterium]
MLSNVERQYALVRLLERQGRLSVTEICDEYSISEATARRDLGALASQGLLQRVHGGAISLRHAAPGMSILDRSQEQVEEKRRIGLAAAELVQDGETVFLGSGTTVLETARSLRSRRNLTIITNSLPVINALAGLSEMSMIVLGGMLRDSELSFIGHITEQALAEVRADKVIIGVRALNLEQGLTNDYLPETLTDRAILSVGREVIVVADHTKFGAVAPAFLAPMKSVHTLITDNQTDAEFLNVLREQGVRIIIA